MTTYSEKDIISKVENKKISLFRIYLNYIKLVENKYIKIFLYIIIPIIILGIILWPIIKFIFGEIIGSIIGAIFDGFSG